MSEPIPQIDNQRNTGTLKHGLEELQAAKTRTRGMSQQAKNINGELNVASSAANIPRTAKQEITCGDICIVLIEPPVGASLNRNVFGYSAAGKSLWQIQESPHGTQHDKPYTSLRINDKNQLIAGNWNGVDYSVNLEDGTVTAVAFDK